MSTSPKSTRSELADDPEMREMVAIFVTTMPERVAALRAAAGERRHGDLHSLAHQLKGAAGGYGFPALGAAAGALAATLESGASASLARIQSGVDELIALCERTIGGAR